MTDQRWSDRERDRDKRPLEVRQESAQEGKELWGFDSKNIPDHVKLVVSKQQGVVQNQFYITVNNIAAGAENMDTGDGALRYLHGWYHKRFGGHFCLLYTWLPRRDGQGMFLAVKGLGQKNGNGNDYGVI